MSANERDYPCPSCGWSAEAAHSSSHHIKPGTMLNKRYYIGQVLGQGGFGITYLGWDTTLDVKIAVKEYFPLAIVTRNPDTMEISCASTQSSADFSYGLDKFLDEARILASFTDSPNIVSARDFFKAYGSAYMIMEYIEGIDLKGYLDKHGGRMPWEQAQGVLLHVMDALRDVHAAGLLHRDISPDNIFITSRGQVKVLDFGAARSALGMQNKSLSVVLKPGYAPVEQYQTRGNQGPWTDVYSLGATLYRCVTGSVPPESLSRLEDDALLSPAQMGVPVSANFEAAVLRALAVKARDRLQSVEDFQAMLLGLPLGTETRQWAPALDVRQPDATMAGSAANPTVIAPPQYTVQTGGVWQAPPQPRESGRRRSLLPLLVAGLLLLVLAGGAAGYFALSRRPPEQYAKPAVANPPPAQASTAAETAPPQAAAVTPTPAKPEAAKPSADQKKPQSVPQPQAATAQKQQQAPKQQPAPKQQAAAPAPAKPVQTKPQTAETPPQPAPTAQAPQAAPGGKDDAVTGTLGGRPKMDLADYHQNARNSFNAQQEKNAANNAARSQRKNAPQQGTSSIY